MKVSRRNFLISISLSTIVLIISFRKLRALIQPRKYSGIVQGASFSRGHLIIEKNFPKATKTIEVSTLIIGAGISGLTAAYFLNKKNDKDFLVLDLENKAGGNAREGKNSQGKYPFAAHYLPVVNEEAKELKEFLKEHGIIKKWDRRETYYDEYMLCSSPQERLYLNGRWQKGLEPNIGLTKPEQVEMKRFFDLMEEFKFAVGSDGKHAFAIPSYLSSRDFKYTKFDNISMAEFLEQNNFKNKYIKWYVDYCSRDDYGVYAKDISAWAGIHYFASRRGECANLDNSKSGVLTWPEGNSFLVKILEKPVQDKIQTNQLVFNIDKTSEGYISSVYDFKNQATYNIKSKNIVYSAPEFTAKHIISNELKKKLDLKIKDYSPWMTATITINAELGTKDSFLAWDSVSFYTQSLGYVFAEHQQLNQVKNEKNITLYWPLSNGSTKRARLSAISFTHQEWCENVVNELEIIHPSISDYISNIDIALFGHGMIVPKVGFLKDVSKIRENEGFYFAHSDQTGISIFEEAFYQGLNVASEISDDA